MLDEVVLKVRGLMLERLVDRALAEGARFGRIERTGAREVTIWTDAHGAKRVEALAERHGLEAERIAERGWSYLKRRLRARAALMVGLVAMLAALGALSMRVWLVEVQVVSGDAEIARAATMATLEQLGISPGVSARSIDPDELALKLQLEQPSLSYVGIRLRGVKLTVEVASEEQPPELYDIEAARDLVALRDAVVISANALSGKNRVKPGDTVRAGQLLISGEERVAGEITRGVRAMGQVVARVWYVGEDSEPLYATEMSDTGRRSLSAELRLLDWAIPLIEGESYSGQRVEIQRLPVVGLFLPLHVVRTTRVEQSAKTVPADMDAVRAVVGEHALALAMSELEQGADPVDEWVDYFQEGGFLRARAVVEARMDIAVDRETYKAYVLEREFE